MVHQPNKTNHLLHDRAPTERVSPGMQSRCRRNSRAGVAELDEAVHPKRDGGEAEFAGAQRGRLLRTVGGWPGFSRCGPSPWPPSVQVIRTVRQPAAAIGEKRRRAGLLRRQGGHAPPSVPEPSPLPDHRSPQAPRVT